MADSGVHRRAIRLPVHAVHRHDSLQRAEPTARSSSPGHPAKRPRRCRAWFSKVSKAASGGTDYRRRARAPESSDSGCAPASKQLRHHGGVVSSSGCREASHGCTSQGVCHRGVHLGLRGTRARQDAAAVPRHCPRTLPALRDGGRTPSRDRACGIEAQVEHQPERPRLPVQAASAKCPDALDAHGLDDARLLAHGTSRPTLRRASPARRTPIVEWAIANASMLSAFRTARTGPRRPAVSASPMVRNRCDSCSGRCGP